MTRPRHELPADALAPGTGPSPPGDGLLAVMDIGSNTGRLVVLRREGGGHLEVVQDVRAPLRLVSALDAEGRLSPEAMERTLAVVRDFRALALGAGAARTIAVATAAVREAANGQDLIARIRDDVGLAVEVLDGSQEARYAFLGAVYGLAVDHGLLVDVGGGSMQIAHFRERQFLQSWSLPLGALRLSVRYLTGDAPTRPEQRRLVQHVQATLTDAGVPALRTDEHLVGTGGTFRTLAKIDSRAHKYPISRLHGYVLTRRRLADIAGLLATQPAAERAHVPGLNADRVDSIVGGALVAQTVLEQVAAREVQVSGQGLRDGLALGAFTAALPPAASVRAGAIAALTSRFATWRAEAARRRSAIALSLLTALEPDAAPEVREALSHAATVLDIGRSIDYYNRHEHTAAILTATDLAGFSHRALALLAATVQRAGDDGRSLKRYRPLVTADDIPAVERAAAILTLAEEIERRCPPGQPLTVRGERQGEPIVLTAPLVDGGRIGPVLDRFRDALGNLNLMVTAEERQP
ncbi:MAG: Ppx/GppA family phosphatase [Chloroflexi bacterium]|nr:Ppx/GppA family phosphatase [Chloroflexota bacterium]